jgi:predicted amidohydrolase
MKAGFYQFEPLFGNKERNIEKVLHVLKDVDADLIVLPEFFATGYQFISRDEVDHLCEYIPQGFTTEKLAELSSSKGMYIVAGLPEKHGDKFFNSAILTGPEGYIGTYRKTHLFFEENLWFTPGDTGFKVFHTAVGRIGIMICFDWIFPESMRTLALKGAEVVAHPSNLVLPYCPSAMPVRCLENRVYAVTANRIGTENRKEGQTLNFIGTSQIVSPDSSVCVKAPEKAESLEIKDITLEKANDKSLNAFNDLFRDRRPGMYQNT